MTLEKQISRLEKENPERRRISLQPGLWITVPPGMTGAALERGGCQAGGLPQFPETSKRRISK